jgi:molybdate transport system substrate-binding protein
MKFTLLFSLWCIPSLLVSGEIRVALAANVSYAIEELKDAFYQQHPHTKVEIVLGSSGKLTAQISHGAPFDLFLSANMKYPETLYSSGLAVTKPIVYAQGLLALLSQSTDYLQGNLSHLASTTLKRIAIANPHTAPYGHATLEALDNAKLLHRVKHKLVYGESISQTVTYATTVTDVGIIAKSALFNPKLHHLKVDTHWVEVDTSLYTPINQGIVILKQGKNNPEVKTFYNFILGAEAKTILKKYGYVIP